MQIIGTLIIIFIPINIIEINAYSIFLLVGSFLFNLLSFGICVALATITENSIFDKIYNEKLLVNKGIIIDFKKVEKVNWYY
ncbi:MAG: hypothetical protein U9R42_04580 [Bacteroidota bacterium]|nr:hypothetical protein [Bacteroidota bacterium]